jgi:hypothetical protein
MEGTGAAAGQVIVEGCCVLKAAKVALYPFGFLLLDVTQPELPDPVLAVSVAVDDVIVVAKGLAP